MQDDKYREALEKLYSLAVFLYGGYYEPKSDRDKQLADELSEIWSKHSLTKEGISAGLFLPKNAHLFTKEAAMKAFAHVEIKEIL